MLAMGVRINAVQPAAALRVPTERGGVGMVNSDRKVDPDRGFRGYDRSETERKIISLN